MSAGDLRRVAADCLHRAVDLLYPPACASCGGPPGPGPSRLCHACRGTLAPVRPPFCGSCGEVFPEGVPDDFRCANCAGRRFAFRFAVAPYQNLGAVRELIHRFKYGGRVALRGPLAALLAEVLDDPRIDARRGQWVLVPVPLHPRRRRDRGFNQSEELARRLAKASGLPAVDVLRRTRDTGAQASLDRRARLENLSGAITVHPRAARRLAGRPVLVVDDVFTTGSTIHECARVLTEGGGAKMVAAITVARG